MDYSEEVFQRRLMLEGAVNFRDVGDYPVIDGRRVRKGLLYRSDSLAELTITDQESLEALGLCSVFDLRHEYERGDKPNRLGGNWAGRTHAIGFFPHGSIELFNRVRNQSISSNEAREYMRVMYSRLPIDQAPAYARMLQLLLEPGAFPAVIHCTSGKDRTGFAIAILMMVLGVAREAIFEDYSLTNLYRRDLAFILGKDADPLVVDVLKGASPDFLQAGFDAMAKHWGSERAFLRSGLGLAAQDQLRLQSILLD